MLHDKSCLLEEFRVSLVLSLRKLETWAALVFQENSGENLVVFMFQEQRT